MQSSFKVVSSENGADKEKFREKSFSSDVTIEQKLALNGIGKKETTETFRLNNKPRNKPRSSGAEKRGQ